MKLPHGIFVCLMVILISATAWFSHKHSRGLQNKLIVGIVDDCPPFSSRNSTCALEGLDIDIAEEIARRLHRTISYRVVTRDMLIPSLRIKQLI